MPGVRVSPAGPLPREALAYLAQKGLKPSFSYLDVWRQEHLHAFTVAKVLERDLLADVHASLLKALTEGQTFKQWSEGVRETFDASGWSAYGAPEDAPRRLLTIFDTNMRVARAQGQWDRAQRTKLALPYFKYELGPREHHRPLHVEWATAPTILPVDHPWWDEHFPPNGWGCFLPGTRIEGAVIGASKAWYTGEAVEIELKSGARLSVTVNHPIATVAGWTGAGHLQIGDQCLSCRNVVNNVVACPGPRSVNDDQIPPRVEEVFDALTVDRAQASFTPSHLDFHGEAASFKGKIRVVGSYVPLMVEDKALRSQRVGQDFFSASDLRLPKEPRSSREIFLAGSLFATARGTVSSSGLLTAFGPRVPRPSDQTRRTIIADRLAPLPQPSVDDRAAYVKFIRKLQDWGPGAIAFDPVVRLRRFNFSGHVYDLETVTGWLSASNIITSNCGCTVRQVSQAEADDLGGETDAPDDGTEEWENPKTGQTEEVPAGVDPGWDYNPGKERDKGLDDALRESGSEAL